MESEESVPNPLPHSRIMEASRVGLQLSVLTHEQVFSEETRSYKDWNVKHHRERDWVLLSSAFQAPGIVSRM